MANRYDRQVRAFGVDGQRKIERSRVGIVGLGGIGSQIAQGLAYLGVRSVVLVDDDRVDETNLNRLIGGLPADAESKSLKVSVMERLIDQINSDATVRAIAKNLRSREALDALISCPVIFGCVDGDGPRLVLTELAAAYEVILMDSATEIVLENGALREFGGRIVVARPGDFCLSCANQIDMEAAKQELESPETRELRRAHGYGLREGVAPSVVSLNGVIANLAITEFLAMTTGIREPNRHLTYYGLRGIVNARQDKRAEDCYTCGYVVGLRDRANIYRFVPPES